LKEESNYLLGVLMLAHYKSNLGAASHSQFPHDVTDVVPYRENRNTQPFSYFTVGQSRCDQLR
jgi:hypothetical protein